MFKCARHLTVFHSRTAQSTIPVFQTGLILTSLEIKSSSGDDLPSEQVHHLLCALSSARGSHLCDLPLQHAQVYGVQACTRSPRGRVLFVETLDDDAGAVDLIR